MAGTKEAHAELTQYLTHISTTQEVKHTINQATLSQESSTSTAVLKMESAHRLVVTELGSETKEIYVNLSQVPQNAMEVHGVCHVQKSNKHISDGEMP